MIPTALSIAGSDPSGGAGVQADLKAFSANGVYGMAALTALTAQNTRGVAGVHLPPPEFVALQISEVFADIRVDAVKIGMIATAEIAAAVADALGAAPAVPIVLDPVMVAKGGQRLLAEDAVETLVRRLLPLAALATPNLPEAAALTGLPEARDRAGMEAAAAALLDLGARAALVKGGHLDAPDSPDLLARPGAMIWIEGARAPTRNTHGSGCTLSAALAAWLARGADLETAARRAKAYLAGAAAAADRLGVGGGRGPTHHFHALWSET